MCYASVYGDLFGFAEDGELAITFCSLATGLLGQTALGAKKILEIELVQKDCEPVGNPSDDYESATTPLKPKSFATYRWDM